VFRVPTLVGFYKAEKVLKALSNYDILVLLALGEGWGEAITAAL
jgi:hypothetical protein